MSDETQPEPITYLLRHSGCISGPTECCFEVAIQKARNMPLGTEVVELYEWPEELITRLRAELAAATAERDRMREALRPFADDAAKYWSDAEYTPDGSAVGVDVGDLRRARAAIEGVTKKSGAGNE